MPGPDAPTVDEYIANLPPERQVQPFTLERLDRARDEQLAGVLALVAGVLGEDAAGIYLYGSAVDGGLRPASDIDVMVVSRRRITHYERQRMVDGLVPISDKGFRPRSWRPLELTIVAQPDVCPWPASPRMEFQYGEWLRDEFRAGNLEPSPEAHADLAVLVTMVLLADTPLVGPPPAGLLEPVPLDVLRRSMTDGLPALMEDLNTDTRNVILTLARVWSSVVTDEIRSKDAAADWALTRLPDEHQAVLTLARAAYLGHEDDQWTGLTRQVREHVDYVLRQIEIAATGGAREGA